MDSASFTDHWASQANEVPWTMHCKRMTCPIFLILQRIWGPFKAILVLSFFGGLRVSCSAKGFCSADLSESAWILPISDHELCWCSHRPVSVQFELGCRSFPSTKHVDMSRLQAGKTEQNSSCSEIDHCIQYGCVAYLSRPQKSKDGTTKPRCSESSVPKMGQPSAASAFLTRWEGRSHHVRAAPTDFARPPATDGMWIAEDSDFGRIRHVEIWVYNHPPNSARAPNHLWTSPLVHSFFADSEWKNEVMNHVFQPRTPHKTQSKPIKLKPNHFVNSPWLKPLDLVQVVCHLKLRQTSRLTLGADVRFR